MTSGVNTTEWQDIAIENRTAFDSDGYQYHFGPNQVKNFLDEGRGAAVAAFQSSPTIDLIVEDAIPFGTSRF